MKTYQESDTDACGPARQTPGAAPVHDRRTEALRRCQQMADDSPRAVQLRQQAAACQVAQRREAAGHTGLPAPLKSGIEALSGLAMDHVTVHYNSARPAQLQAHAYAQGSEIHLAPGQEQHLPHEAWHVVQQAQGRVRPTVQRKAGVAVNDDAALEAEADAMGSRASQMHAGRAPSVGAATARGGSVLQAKGERTAVLDTRDTTRSAGEAIRRGNRRASVSNTGGRSSAKLAITYKAPNQDKSTGYRNRIGELKAYVKRRMVAVAPDSGPQADALLRDKDTFLQAKAVEEISVGNCGEFAMVVFAHLVQHTDNQYVYRAKMAGNVPGSNKPYDHAFAMTSPQNMPVVPNVTDVTGFDRDTTTIADAWDGYQVMTLAYFMNRGNAYRTSLGNGNVVIKEKAAATGVQVLPDAVLGYIRDWAVNFNADFASKMGDPDSTYAKVAARRALNPTGFDTNGSNIAGVDDRRTLAQQIGNSTPAERDAAIAAATDDELFGYLSTLGIAASVPLLLTLPDARILGYVNRCWNKGFWQQFAVASWFPYKSDLVAALPPDLAYRLLQQLPQAGQRRILDGMGDTERQAIESQAPMPTIVII